MSLVKCVAELINRQKKLEQGMTKRERIAYAAGLRAAHMEEAIVSGETPRAVAHAKKLDKLMLELERTQ